MASWLNRLKPRTKVIGAVVGVLAIAGIGVGSYFAYNTISASTPAKQKVTVAINNWDQAGQSLFHLTFGNDAKFRCTETDIYVKNPGDNNEILAATRSIANYDQNTLSVGLENLKTTIESLLAEYKVNEQGISVNEQAKRKQRALDDLNKTVIPNSTYFPDGKLKTACDRGKKNVQDPGPQASIDYVPALKVPAQYQATTATGGTQATGNNEICVTINGKNVTYNKLNAGFNQWVPKGETNIDHALFDTGSGKVNGPKNTDGTTTYYPYTSGACSGSNPAAINGRSKSCFAKISDENSTFGWYEQTDDMTKYKWLVSSLTMPGALAMQNSVWVDAANPTGANVATYKIIDSSKCSSLNAGDGTSAGSAGTATTEKNKICVNVNGTKTTYEKLNVPDDNFTYWLSIDSSNSTAPAELKSSGSGTTTPALVYDLDKSGSGFPATAGSCSGVSAAGGAQATDGQMVLNVSAVGGDGGAVVQAQTVVLVAEKFLVGDTTKDQVAIGVTDGQGKATVSIKQTDLKKDTNGKEIKKLQIYANKDLRPAKSKQSEPQSINWAIGTKDIKLIFSDITAEEASANASYAAQGSTGNQVVLTTLAASNFPKGTAGFKVALAVPSQIEESGFTMAGGGTVSVQGCFTDATIKEAQAQARINSKFGASIAYADLILQTDTQNVGNAADSAGDVEIPNLSTGTALAAIGSSITQPFYNEGKTAYNTVKSQGNYKNCYDFTINFPDNGKNSAVVVKDIAQGIYKFTASKNGWSQTQWWANINGSSNDLGMMPIIPTGSSLAPPSIVSGSVEKLVGYKLDVYRTTGNFCSQTGGEALFISKYPWYGWQCAKAIESAGKKEIQGYVPNRPEYKTDAAHYGRPVLTEVPTPLGQPTGITQRLAGDCLHAQSTTVQSKGGASEIISIIGGLVAYEGTRQDSKTSGTSADRARLNGFASGIGAYDLLKNGGSRSQTNITLGPCFGNLQPQVVNSTNLASSILMNTVRYNSGTGLTLSF